MAGETTERKPDWIERTLSIQSETKHLGQVREFITNAIIDSHMPDRFTYRVTACVDEAVTNIIQHAYEYDIRGSIEISVSIDRKRCRIVIQDNGREFDPEHVKKPDIRAHIQKGKTHGLGIFLMRQLMDKVEYEFVKGVRNYLLLEKYF